MQDPRSATPHHSAFSVDNIIFAAFRHKAIVLICALAGLIAAAIVYRFYPTTYESEAKLLVRYIVERSSVDPIDGAAHSTGSEAVLGNEAEIIRSWDLAQQVADAVGIQKLTGSDKPAEKERGAAAVASGLHVLTERGSNIILISYENAKPELTTLVLNELVNRYFVRHLEVHRSAGAFDFVSQQTDQVRARLNQTEDALRSLNEKVGIASINESMAAINAEMTRTEEQLRGVDAEVAEQRARVAAIEGAAGSQSPTVRATPAPRGTNQQTAAAASPGSSPVTANAAPAVSTAVPLAPPAAEPSAEEADHYRTLSIRLEQLRKADVELSARYTSEQTLVKSNRAEMNSVREQMRRLEKKFPGLVGTDTKGDTDLLSERAKFAGLAAKANELKSRLQEVRARFKQLADAAPQIVELQRKKEMEETNLKYFQSTLEKARIDEALDPSKIPNISAVQRPSPPSPVSTRRDKIATGLALGGLPFGIALALLMETLLNRTVKRGVEIETALHVPVLLSIPQSKTNGHVRRLTGGNSPGGNGTTTLAPWDAGHFIRPYSEAIRDRLGLYFELANLTHKPKLIGVAGVSEGAGASTLAAGLAAALSEVGEGKVLLVDVKLGPEDVHPFFKGRPALPLAAAVERDNSAPAADNLYLATVGSSAGGLAQLGLKKFFSMMPNVKASDFDYVIFDMPPVKATSPTLGMSPFMDQILLVVEAEATNRDVVKRRYASLAGERNNVSVVLNKTRSYLPKWVHGGIDS